MNHYLSITLIVVSSIVGACGEGGGAAQPDGGDADSAIVSSDATLQDLIGSAGELSPAFAPSTTSYTILVANDVVASTMTPTVNQSDATVTVNGAAVSSGAASEEIALAVGENEVTIVVTAEDGTTEAYTVVIVREAVVSIALLDPTPSAGHQFGSNVVQLGNGNIVVTAPTDSTRFTNNGAVHLYSPLSSTPIASIFGNAGNDQLGLSGVTALANNNFVIASPVDNEGGILQAGSIRVINGSTGVQVGETIAGDVEFDRLGLGGVTALANSNFVVTSNQDDENGIDDAGSVRLIDGSTGAQLTALVGQTSKFTVSRRVTVLANGNYIVSHSTEVLNGLENAGTVRLLDGSTGAQVGPTLAGDQAGDFLGSSSVVPLANDNFVIASGADNVNGVVRAGSVRLVDGSTGEQIGATLAGDVENDQLGSSSITALGNNNYVIASSADNEGGLDRAGSVRLVNGTTGLQIGATLAGDDVGDSLGRSGVRALANNNYVVGSTSDRVNNNDAAGSVRLMNGSTGEPIGAPLVGDQSFDQIGSSGIVVLPNDNYVVASVVDTVNGTVGAGSVRLMNGVTGEEIGVLVGALDSDQLGGFGVTALSNNNYVIGSSPLFENGVGNPGSLRLASGTTGEQLGPTLAGDDVGDSLGSGGITELANSSYVIMSSSDDVNGIVNSGSVRLADGTTGEQIGNTLPGEAPFDLAKNLVIKPVSGNYYILGLSKADKNGLVDSGSVRIIAL